MSSSNVILRIIFKKYIPERRAHKEVIYSERLSWTHWCLLDPLSDLLSPISLSLFHSHSFSHSVSISFDSCHVWALTPSYMRTAGEKLKPPFSDAVIYSHKRWKNCKTAFAHVMSSIEDVMKIEWRCQWLSSRFNLVIFHWKCSWYYIVKQF